MKKMFVLWMLIACAMICSCQKQDSAAERQFAQRKAELDAREGTLNEREQALAESEKALAEREKALTESERANLDDQDQTPGPAPVNSESDGRIQQFPPQLRSPMADPSQMAAAKAEKERLTQGQLGARSQPDPGEAERRRQRKWEAMQNWQNSGATSPTPSATSR